MDKGFRFGKYYINGMLAVAFTGLAITMTVLIGGHWWMLSKGIRPESREFDGLMALPWSLLIVIMYSLRAWRVWAFMANICFLAAVTVGCLIGGYVLSNFYLYLPVLAAVAAAFYFFRKADLFPSRTEVTVKKAMEGYVPSAAELKLRRLWKIATIARLVFTFLCIFGHAAMKSAIGKPAPSGEVSRAVVDLAIWGGGWLAWELFWVLGRRGTRLLLFELVSAPVVIISCLTTLASFAFGAFFIGQPLIGALFALSIPAILSTSYYSYRLRKIHLAFRARREQLAQSGDLLTG